MRVLHDVRNGLVSPDGARRDYGVVIDTESWTVDEESTVRLRADLRDARGDVPPSEVSRDDEVGADDSGQV
jgi:hypothetical protein